MDIASLLLAIPALGLLLFLGVKDFGAEFRRSNKSGMFYLILGIPVLIFLLYKVANWDISQTFMSPGSLKITFAIILAALISIMWIIYLTWLDLYERESKRIILLIFVLSCISTFGVFPISDLINNLGFRLNGELMNDFLYCIVGIGMVEELVKFLPWFLLWRYSKQINEPFDFVLYASVSALGFAFIENILYLNNSDLTAVYARALYSSVAHMFFSSIIAYGWVWWEYKGHKFNFLAFLTFLIIASFAHGFYDFWFIHQELNLEILTLLFFLLSLKIWVIMKNNLINISTFYKPELKLQSNVFLYRLINMMLVILLVALLGYNLLHGYKSTIKFAWESLKYYSYIFAFITISFSSYTVIPGYLGNYKLSNIFWPKLLKHPDFTGRRISFSKRGRIVRGSTNMLNKLVGKQHVLSKRVVIDSIPNSYSFRANGERVILQFIKRHPQLQGVWQVVIYAPKIKKHLSRDYFRHDQLKREGDMLIRISSADQLH